MYQRVKESFKAFGYLRSYVIIKTKDGNSTINKKGFYDNRD